MVNIKKELDIRDTIKYQEALTIKLSKNFKLSEFMYSSVALRKGIDNDIPRKYLPRIQYLVDTVIQPVRDKFGPIKINSGYRSVDLCIAVGSNSHSNHAYGFAADIEPYNKNTPLMDVLEFIHNECKYKELIGEFFPTGWVHVAAQKDNNKQVLKLKDKYHDYSIVDLDTIKKSVA